MTGLIHLYTGKGKGKTTAALGLVMRAYGRGKRIVLVQFLKGRDTGELHTLARMPGLTLLRYTKDFGFYHAASQEDKTEMIRQNNANLAQAIHMSRQGLCDLLILDEVCAAYTKGAVDRARVDDFISSKPSGLELVLTGREAPPHFVEWADYVTEFVNHKHPYDQGIAAREGIEF